MLTRAKLYIPRIRATVVPRPRLVARLNEGMKCKLTLISAPAGFGKTTLLSEWCSSPWGSQWPIAWLSLDEGDNDPVRFWSYFIAALQTVEPGLGENALSLLHSLHALAIEDIVPTLCNEISRSSAVARDFALVLDDYHVIDSQDIHRAVASLLDHLPVQMHLVIASRVDPPLPLARLRASGHLLELRHADLRLTRQETTWMLNTVMGLGLSAEDVAALKARNEGWCVGVQLAALSLREQKDVSALVASLGSHRHVFDYLIEEVLQHQPESVQRFLLETCILERLSAPLCDAVRGQTGSQTLLELLERHNLFIVPLDEERRWYRYHYLFAESLRHHLERAELSGVQPLRLLHQRAAAWYEENGLMGEAVEHALAAGDQARAAQLIEQTAWMALARRETATVLRWLAALSTATRRAHPRLYLYQAWALALSEHLEAAEDCLNAVAPLLKAEVEDAEMRRLHGEVTGVRAWIATLRGQVRQAVDLSCRALELLPERDAPVRSAVVFNLASAYWKAGDVVRASQMEMEVAAQARAANDTPVVICALANQAELQRVQGHLHQAHALFQQALSLAQERGLRSAACAGFPCLGVGMLLYEWNRLDEAADYLLRAVELGQQSGEQLVLVDSPLMLAKVRMAQGDARDALALVQRGERSPSQTTAVRHSGREEAHRAWIDLLRSDLRAAGRWEEECGLDVEDDMDQINMREFEYLVLARVLIAQGRSDPAGRQLERALHLLPRVLAGAEASGRGGSVIEILMLEALAHGARGARHRALEALAQALTRAEPEGYVRLFLDEGEPMQALLRQAVARGIAPAYGTALLAAWTAGALPDSAKTGRETAEAIVEPLSERELALLRLAAVGLSNSEIAAEMMIGVNTVKWHLSRIYGKLGVCRRTQAVARAKSLGLLP